MLVELRKLIGDLPPEVHVRDLPRMPQVSAHAGAHRPATFEKARRVTARLRDGKKSVDPFGVIMLRGLRCVQVLEGSAVHA